MPEPPLKPDPIFILAGTSQQYSEARRKLDLLPIQAVWLTSPTSLLGKQQPLVYRYGDCKALLKLQEIEIALQAIAAEVRLIT